MISIQFHSVHHNVADLLCQKGQVLQISVIRSFYIVHVALYQCGKNMSVLQAPSISMLSSRARNLSSSNQYWTDILQVVKLI